MRHAHTPRPDAAFTRLDLLALLAALALLALAATPMLAGNTPRTEQAVCQSNLRAIGRAYQMWAADHGEEFPMRVRPAEGGTYDHASSGNSWFQIATVSNELVRPQFLVCPTDTAATKMARTWGLGADGFLHSSMRGNAISYSLYLHASPSNPRGILFSDRKLRFLSSSAGCSYTVGIAMEMTRNSIHFTGWTNGVHGITQNILHNDGSAQAVDTPGYRAILNQTAFGSGLSHVLQPN